MHRWVLFILSLTLGLVFQCKPVFSADTDALPLKQPLQIPLILKRAAEASNAQLRSMDQDLARAARSLAALDLNSEAARGVIRQLQAKNADMVIDAAIINPQGVMRLVEPAPYRSFEGTDISDQAQLQTLLRTRKPVMSRVFRTVEGVAAVDMEHPLMRTDGHFLGSVSVIFQPWVLIGKCVKDLIAGVPVEIWAMQPDGMIIYDADRQEVGRMLFSAPAYGSFPELLQLGKRIATESEGSGSYSFFKAGSDDVVRKDAWWVTIMMHGMKWRLVSVHPAESAGTVSSAEAAHASTSEGPPGWVPSDSTGSFGKAVSRPTSFPFSWRFFIRSGFC